MEVTYNLKHSYITYNFYSHNLIDATIILIQK